MAFKVINNEVITNTEDGQLENLAIDGTSVLVGDGLGNVTLQNVTLDATVAIGALDIDDLGDVDTVSTPPSNGDALVWNSTSSVWEPQAPFSQTDFDTAFSGKDTDDLTEGTTNLYLNGTGTTDNLTEGATNLYLNGTGTTSDLTEGANLYYTTARANTDIDARVTTTFVNALNVTAAAVQADSVTLGTDTTGNYVATITGTTNEVEVSGSGSESAAVTIGLPVDVTITNDLVVGGDLTVNGTTVTIGASNLSVADSFVYLNNGDAIGDSGTNFTGTGVDDAAFYGYFTGTSSTTYYVRIDGTVGPDTFEWSKDNFSTTEATGVTITGAEQLLDNNIKIKFDTTSGHTLGDVWDGTASPADVDTGWWSNRNSGASAPGYTHLGVYFDVSDNKFKIVDEYDPEPTGTINTGDASFSLATLVADTFEGSLTGNATTATTLATGRTISLTGDVTGTSGSFDGSGNVSIAATIAANSVALGTDTTGNYVQQGATSGSGISGSVNSEGGTFTVTSNATSANTANTIVFRDASGNFNAGTITGSLSGNASTATTATNVTATANNTTNETVYLTFVDGATGSQGIETDTDLTYNPSTGNLSILGDFTAGGDVTAYNTSDVTLKENVVAIENALNKVKAIRGVTFDWKDEVIERKGGEDGYFVRKQDVGVIAQEVEEVLPEVVATKEDGTKAVRYEKLVALLIEAVKEQQNQIDSLKLEIQAIKDK